MEEIAPGDPPQGAKTCFFLLSMQRGLSATYSAPISTIFEGIDVNPFRMCTSVKNFSNFCAVVFQVQNTAQNTVLKGTVFVIELQLKRCNLRVMGIILGLVEIPPQGCAFCTRVLVGGRI